MDSSVKSCHVLQRVSYNDEMNEYKNCNIYLARGSWSLYTLLFTKL